MRPKAKPLVLIADDDKILAQLLASHMSKAGFQTLVTFDAMQASMAAMRTTPALIILDINMPGGTGIEVLRRIKSSARTHHVPVIVLTGSLSPEERETVLGLGADEFLRKPLNVDELRAAVDRVVSAHHEDGGPQVLHRRVAGYE